MMTGKAYFAGLMLMGISLSLSITNSKLDAQPSCPAGMVCINAEKPVPDIGPLPDTARVQSGPKEELGKLLFCDHRLSDDIAYACAQCHRPSHGFADDIPISAGFLGGSTGIRNTPGLFNLEYTIAPPKPPLMWDGRIPDPRGTGDPWKDPLVQQMLIPLKGDKEMHMSYEKIQNRFNGNFLPEEKAKLEEVFPVSDREMYKAKFKQVFGKENIIPEDVYRAIAAFERTIISTDSPFDQYMRTKKFSEKFREDVENKGMDLFKDKARCILCHYGPNFTDNKFHNVGWPAVPDRNNPKSGHWKYHLEPNGRPKDLGRYGAQEKMKKEGLISASALKEPEIGAFKTPTLRNLSQTWPFMHDGGIPVKWTGYIYDQKPVKAFEEVVDFFSAGGGEGNPFHDPLVKRINLTPNEKMQLIAFLKSLSEDPVKLENCPWPVRGGR
jgi:cytochrome c peroxidase